ncbi:MAG: MBL fold metallo-hydrolase [Actinomycetota bacterium]
MSFTVTVLGSAAMFSTSERACAGYLVRFGETNLWLDAGGGTWRNLLKEIDYRDIHGVLLTHRHPDHTVDVFQAFHARMYGQAEALPKIPLWAPAETIERLTAYTEHVGESFDLNEVEAGSVLHFGGADLTFYAMAHPPVTVGVRIEYEGAVFAYSSDTGKGADFSRLADDADLFICEATFQEGDEDWEGHLHASDAGAVAAKCGVEHLVLTHLPPGRDLSLTLAEAHRDADGVKVELARDGDRFEVTR